MDFTGLVPPAGPMMRELEPPFHGKRAIVLPPFLAKAFMDMDMEDAAELAMVGCKILQDFDAQMVWGKCGVVEESKDGDPVGDGPAPAQGQRVMVTFCYVIQFLYLVAMGNLSRHPPEVLTILQATDWATRLTASKLGMMMGGNLGLVDGGSPGVP